VGYINPRWHWVMAAIWLIASVVLGWGGLRLQHVVFHQPPPPGQVYAAVFVLDQAAHVSLSAEIYPDEPWIDSLSLTVKDVPRRQSGWLLVIECPANAPYQTPAVRLYSYSKALSQTQSAPTIVGFYAGTASTESRINFHCFLPPGTSSGALGTSQNPPSLANVSVPALQLDQGMAATQALPVLYARQNLPGGPISQLVEVFPGVGCPSVTPTPAPAASGSAAVSASSSAAASPQPSGGPTGAAPSPSQQATAPATPSCLGLVPAGTKVIQYGIPGTEATAETLNHVDPKGYQISMFPVGTTMGDSITWNSAQSALDPDFNATNIAAENDASRDIFISGILFGLLGGTAVGCAEHVFQALTGL
jgi:hypothetical protein